MDGRAVDGICMNGMCADTYVESLQRNLLQLRAICEANLRVFLLLTIGLFHRDR